ncbi:F-box/LRR-repeat protein 3-like isoform X7 [Herrania umbratica]|uniref:F-box/LRR-repeat protein 3-like isoform X7 n=1 Tax=Herrania umbratica TaxID=108875 RepID=A0A6J0ZXF7_9ROSI|nr:F-box/LRR-repeat protein 3-like isoform X7 [Herrania umbratica]
MKGQNKEKMQALSPDSSSNPFDVLTEEVVLKILDYLDTDEYPSASKSFSLTCKAFYFIESRHRKTLKPLRTELLPRTLHRYPFVSHLDLSLCPRVDDSTLNVISSTWKATLHSINLSRSRFFTNDGLSSLFVNCSGLVEVDLSNGTELTDLAASAIAEAKNLERLKLARCKLITDMGIGCIAVGCRKLRLLSLKWCLRVGDLGVELIALKCKEIRSLDLSYLPITEKCVKSVLQLQHLEDLVLEGCHGIDDDGLSTLKQSCKSLKMLNLSNCQNVTHTGLSSLTNGAQQLQQLILAYGSVVSLKLPKVTSDIAKCLHTFSKLQSIKLDGCLITSSGIKAMASLHASIKELSFSKCLGVTDEGLSFLVQSHKELRKLDITCCRKITYTSIDSITNSCTSLSSLRMESCSLVPKEAFILIGARCSCLEELDATDNEIDDEGLKSISRCSKLSILKLGICTNISDEGLANVGSFCSMLTELDLYRSMAISDAGIAAVADGCPALEMINMAYNAIAVGCKQLTVLDVKKCFNINDNGMLPLAQFSQNLKQINLSYCSVTDVGLVALASLNRLQNMTILHLAGLTPNGLAAALLACRGLTKVKLHASFRPLLPQSFLQYMGAHGCVFHWRDKAFQKEMDPKGWKLHFGRSTEVP